MVLAVSLHVGQLSQHVQRRSAAIAILHRLVPGGAADACFLQVSLLLHFVPAHDPLPVLGSLVDLGQDDLLTFLLELPVFFSDFLHATHVSPDLRRRLDSILDKLLPEVHPVGLLEVVPTQFLVLRVSPKVFEELFPRDIGDVLVEVSLGYAVALQRLAGYH